MKTVCSFSSLFTNVLCFIYRVYVWYEKLKLTDKSIALKAGH